MARSKRSSGRNSRRRRQMKRRRQSGGLLEMLGGKISQPIKIRDLALMNTLEVFLPEISLLVTGETVLGIITILIRIITYVYFRIEMKTFNPANIAEELKTNKSKKDLPIVILYLVIDCIIVHRMIGRNNTGKTVNIFGNNSYSVEQSDWTYVWIIVKIYYIIAVITGLLATITDNENVRYIALIPAGIAVMIIAGPISELFHTISLFNRLDA